MSADISARPTYYLRTYQVFGYGTTTCNEQAGYHISPERAAQREDARLRDARVGRTYWHNGGPCIRYEEPHTSPELACITTLEWRTP